MKNITQKDILKEYYKNNPGRDIPHKEIVDWVTEEYAKRTGKVFRDPDRGIRSLYQQGFLIKVQKGIYRYDPEIAHNRIQHDFTQARKEEILKRDGYKCVICGKGKQDGVELHVDHIKPKELGGKAVVSNGQTLCSQHNMLKKNLNQTEIGKKMFIRFYELANERDEWEISHFCEDILEVYEKHKMDSHIRWNRGG